MKALAHGIYEALLDEFLSDALAQRPELRTVFGKLDPEEQPGLYASFVAKVLEQALREEVDPEKRMALCNRILGQVANEPGRGHLEKHRLVPEPKSMNRVQYRNRRRSWRRHGVITWRVTPTDFTAGWSHQEWKQQGKSSSIFAGEQSGMAQRCEKSGGPNGRNSPRRKRSRPGSRCWLSMTG